MKAGHRGRWIAMIGSVLAMAVLAGCTSTQATTTGGEQADMTLYTVHAPFVQMEQEQIILTTEDALREFSESHDGIVDSEEFQNEVGTLGEDFFAEKILLCAVVPGGSGAESYQLKGVSCESDGTVQMTAERTAEEVGIAEMSQWYLIAEVPRDSLEAVPDTFTLVVEE